MPKVRVLDSDNSLVAEFDVEDADVEATMEEWGADGCTLLFDALGSSAPNRASTPAVMASPPHPLGSAEQTARAVITQTLLDFHAASQQLLAQNLEQTRYWLALGTSVVDEDLRRRGLLHKAIQELDIADRSIGVLQFQKHAKWAPAPAPEPAANDQDGNTIADLIGASVKAVFDRKN